jgi:putative SOS response-associated peptidase YedK
MCARFSLAGPERIADRYPQFKLRNVWPRRYNIAPTQDVLAARNDGEREIAPLRWGLVPFWARDLAIGQKLINARAETLAEKPAFRSALQKRRCIIFADGFYEWTGAKGRKQPHRFTVDDGAPFAFAGLWERWGPKDAPVETCAIVTCAPNALCAPMHDRMPAILDDSALDAWLYGDVAEALDAIVPYDAARMRSALVTPQMNHHAFEDPRCIEPLTAPELTLL